MPVVDAFVAPRQPVAAAQLTTVRFFGTARMTSPAGVLPPNGFNRSALVCPEFFSEYVVVVVGFAPFFVALTVFVFALNR